MGQFRQLHTIGRLGTCCCLRLKKQSRSKKQKKSVTPLTDGCLRRTAQILCVRLKAPVTPEALLQQIAGGSLVYLACDPAHLLTLVGTRDLESSNEVAPLRDLLGNHVGFDVLDGLLELGERGLNTLVGELVRFIVAQPFHCCTKVQGKKKNGVVVIVYMSGVVINRLRILAMAMSSSKLASTPNKQDQTGTDTTQFLAHQLHPISRPPAVLPIGNHKARHKTGRGNGRNESSSRICGHTNRERTDLTSQRRSITYACAASNYWDYVYVAYLVWKTEPKKVRITACSVAISRGGRYAKYSVKPLSVCTRYGKGRPFVKREQSTHTAFQIRTQLLQIV